MVRNHRQAVVVKYSGTMRKAVDNPPRLCRCCECQSVAAIVDRETLYLVSQVIFRKNVIRQSQLIQVLCRADGLFPPVRISLEEVERMNKVILLGNLTKDAEVRYTQSGKAFVKVGIAVTRNYKNGEGERDTDFFNLLAWDKTAEFFAKYLRKGTKILVEGRLQNNNYEKDGVKHYGQDIIVQAVEFAGGKKDDSKTNAAKDLEGDAVQDDDIPF